MKLGLAIYELYIPLAPEVEQGGGLFSQRQKRFVNIKRSLDHSFERILNVLGSACTALGCWTRTDLVNRQSFEVIVWRVWRSQAAPKDIQRT